ncbi:hypothetical protein IMSAGC005_01818 [Lachnospiraceae bacterium]|nr:hypothetical protein IMSAGC005_01818 [Lachnospiraceae bacterium]
MAEREKVVIVIDGLQVEAQLMRAYERLKEDTRFRVTFQKGLYRPEYWLEIMPSKASKAVAINELKKSGIAAKSFLLGMR